MTDSPSFHAYIRLEQPRLGTRVTYASDEFFAAKERLIDPAAPIFIDDKYDDHGKWMDGWESRRRRTPGNDCCVVRLGVAGVVRGLDIDTSHFTGNFPPEASVDACVSDVDVPEEGWRELVAKTNLTGDAHHYITIESDEAWTHLRLNIFPDGGVARLRIYGEVMPDLLDEEGVIDLVALRHGGRALSASDEHYGSKHNLNLPGRGVNMGDGWETARRRGPGNDWVMPVRSNVPRWTRHTSREIIPIESRSRQDHLRVTMKLSTTATVGGHCCRKAAWAWISNIFLRTNCNRSARSPTFDCQFTQMVE